MPAGQLEEGTLLNGRYRILRPLGRGGMGTVYLAEHIQLDAVLAVKEVRSQQSDDADYQAALAQCGQEARFLVRLNHPHLPKVTDAFIENDRFYLVMEYIEGVTLEARLKETQERPIPVEQVLEWGLQIADVLAYLHSQQPPIIFRDLKPANIMMQPDGEVRLIDFGIARRFQEGAEKDTDLFGSVGYSPPEQFGRHQTDTRSDIYAFGATLHHLLTGRDPSMQPFKFPPARSLNPEVPEALSRLLEECLAMDANARPASVHGVALRLLAVRDELAARPFQAAVSATAFPPTERAGPPVDGRRGSGPRIISAKLAEAETQKRRSASRDIPRVPTGPAPGGTLAPASRGRWPTGVLVGIGVAAVVIGSAAAYLLSNRPHRHDVTPVNVPVVRPTPAPDSTPVSPVIPTAPAPPIKPSGTDPPLPAPTDHSAVFDRVQPEGLVRDEQGDYLLRLNVTGHIRGHKGASGVLAAFFYDADDHPVHAVDPHSVYANQDGQLSVAHSLQVSQDDQPIDIEIDVPVSQFPPPALSTPLKFRCVVFMEGQRIGESDMTPIPFALSSVPPAPGNGSGAPGPPPTSPQPTPGGPPTGPPRGGSGPDPGGPH